MTLMSFAYPGVPLQVRNALIDALAAVMSEERHRALCTVGQVKPCDECRRLRIAAVDQIEKHYRAIADLMQVKNEGPQGATPTARTQEGNE
jgi:hypothetical protein